MFRISPTRLPSPGLGSSSTDFSRSHGFQVHDHGQIDNDDGTVTVVGYCARTDTSGIVAQIQALGLQPSVTTAADQKKAMMDAKARLVAEWR